MSRQGTHRRAGAGQTDRNDVGESGAPSGDEQDGTSPWLLLRDVYLMLMLSILVAVVSMGVFWVMEAIRTFNIDPMRDPPPLELGWVVAGGVAIGLAVMAGAYARRRETKRERVLQVACALFLTGALVAGAVALGSIPPETEDDRPAVFVPVQTEVDGQVELVPVRTLAELQVLFGDALITVGYDQCRDRLSFTIADPTGLSGPRFGELVQPSGFELPDDYDGTSEDLLPLLDPSTRVSGVWNGVRPAWMDCQP